MRIIFNKVSKNFGKNISALDETSFEINDGEFVFLVGSSGAGKTTILRLIIQDLIPSNGKIEIDKFVISKKNQVDTAKLRRKIGMIFQDFKILYNRTTFENIAIALEILGKKPDEISKKVHEVLHLVGLSDKADFFPIQLSAGELQRASIARAIVGGPKILLADEPTGNLDPTTSWEIMKILREINDLGTTVIMATHNADIVNSLNKRVITIKKGKVIKDEKTGKYQ